MNHRPLAVGVTAALLVAAASARAQQAPTRIAVVNLKDVLNKIQEVKEFHEHMVNQQQLLAAKAKGDQASLADMDMKRRNLRPDSDAFEQATKDLEKAMAAMQADEQLHKADWTREQNREFKRLYDAAQAAAATVAKENGFDLVLVDNPLDIPPNAQEVNPDQLLNQIFQTRPLYVADKVNITEKVIAAMDAQYKAHGNGDGSSPATGGAGNGAR